MVDLDTFLTALYVLVDDLDQQTPDGGWRGRGPEPGLSRSEVVTMAVFGQWAQFGSERRFYRFAQRHLRAAFPHLPTRSQYNRQLRRAVPLLVAVGQVLAHHLTPRPCAYEVLDSTGVVVRHTSRRGTGWLDGQADRGYCTRLGWYTGLHLLTVVTPQGVITGFGCAPATAADQALAETLLAARRCPQPGLPEAGQAQGGGYYLADTGFEGRRWGRRWHQAYAARVLVPPKRHQPFPTPWPRALRRAFAGWRQIVESVHDKLLNQFHLSRERPHQLAGFRARLAATVALHNFCCWLNQQHGQPLLAFANLLDW